MKIYAVINWKEKEPQITAVNGLPLVMINGDILTKIFDMIKSDIPSDIKTEIIEFESKDN